MKTEIIAVKRHSGLSEGSSLYHGSALTYKKFTKAEDSENKVLEFLIPRVKDKIVVDLGCGNGKYASLLKNYVKFYIGIDNSLEQISLARSAVNEKNIIFINASAEKISLNSGYADIVISTWGLGSINGIERKKKAIKESERILKPNGALYIIENEPRSEFQKIRGTIYEERTKNYNRWLIKEGFIPIKSINTYFNFDSTQEARKVFRDIWGNEIAQRLTSKRIDHVLIVFKKEKKEIGKDLLKRVRESAKYVVRRAELVRIDPIALTEFSKKLKKSNFEHWLKEAPYNFSNFNTKQKLHLLVLFNAVSFSYWGNPKWEIKYRGKSYDGSWAMLLSFIRAYEEGKPIFNANYLARLDIKTWKNITRGNTEIPFLKERLQHLNEIGETLSREYKGNFENVLLEADFDSVKLIAILISKFSCFRDISEYEGKTVYFFKRAQELTGDVHRWFKGQNVVKLRNVECLTACADYKLPQILREADILEYSPLLADKIDSGQEIAKNSKEEIEIRASTVLAVDLILEQLKKRIPDLLAADINDYLWLESQHKKGGRKPYHLVRTTNY